VSKLKPGDGSIMDFVDHLRGLDYRVDLIEE